MWKLLAKVNKNLVIAIPAAMLLGFVFGLSADTTILKDLIMLFTFLMVYPMMVTLKVKKLLEGGDGKAQLLTQFINFAIIPFVALGIGMIFFSGRPYMTLGLLLAALVPTSGMTISWTGFAKGNLEAAIKMTVAGLTLGSLATPFYLTLLMGAKVDVNILGVMKQIGLIVFVPMVLGYLTQWLITRQYGQKVFQERFAPRFPALSTIGVLAIVFIAVAMKAKAIAGSPDVLLLVIAPLVVLYGVNYLISTVAGKALLPRGDAVALVYGTVMRNLSIALAIALNAFGPAGSDAALVISVAYIIQVQSAAWYVRLTDKVFGPVTTPGVKRSPAPA